MSHKTSPIEKISANAYRLILNGATYNINKCVDLSCGLEYFEVFDVDGKQLVESFNVVDFDAPDYQKSEFFTSLLDEINQSVAVAVLIKNNAIPIPHI